MDIKISPEELQEHSVNIVKKTRQIFECINKIEEAKRSLDSWKSPNKEMFFQKLDAELKKMRQMAEAAESYGLVGNDVATRVLGVESGIRDTIAKMN